MIFYARLLIRKHNTKNEETVCERKLRRCCDWTTNNAVIKNAVVSDMQAIIINFMSRATENI